MSQSISAFGAVGRPLAGTLMIRDRLDVVSRQISTGLVADTYGGLAPNASTSISIRAELARREAYSNAIEFAELRIRSMQPSLARIGEIASDLAADALAAVTRTVGIEVVAEEARSGLVEMMALLNSEVGGVFVFGGTDTARPPVPDASRILQSGFFTQIQAAVQQYALPWDDDADPLTPDVPRGATQVLADTLAIAASDAAGTTPFSAFLSTPSPDGGLGEPRAWIAGDDGQRITYGLRANENGVAISPSDPPSTQSFIRDIMRGLAVLGSLTDPIRARDETGLDDDAFKELLTGLSVSLRSASQMLGIERGAIGVSEKRLAALKERHADITVVLKTQVSAIEDVDMSEVSVRAQFLQTQLEMSYRLIASFRELNLARYI
jgi:flagellar hook-associated protein 3 FlgL